MRKMKAHEIKPIKRNERYEIAFGIFFNVAVITIFLVLNFSTFYLSRDDFVGTYKSEYVGMSRELRKKPHIKNGIYLNGTHRLDLREDGTYDFLFQSVSGEEIRYSGDWEYNRYAGDEKVIRLYGYYPFFDEDYEDRANCCTIMNVKKRGMGRLLLPLDPEDSVWFVKQIGRDKLKRLLSESSI